MPTVIPFLARVPESKPRAVLYSMLKVVPMARADYFVNHVLEPERWQAFSAHTRLVQLSELQTHFEDMKSEEVALSNGPLQTFGDFFSRAPLFRSDDESSPRWLTVRELLDPSVPLHRAFFAERLPPAALCTTASLEWLRRCGMDESLTRAAFYEV